ncbi:MAG: restriction endonuclease subunit S, partial [Lachnospiraceae bacterium]|nr:restriction endonuclease subunit S [Lachnospiraceae bacterium]
KFEFEFDTNEQKQNEIVATLSRVETVIACRKRELELLDDLIKARFVEMFGEPQINPFHWDVVNISEVVGGEVSNGFFAKRDDYCDDGNVSVLGVANIVNRMYSKVDELPKTNANNKDIEKFEVKYGDMLFCRSSLVAEGIGKASIVPEDVQENVLFECHVIRLPLNLNKCVPEFMQTLSTMDFFRNQVVAQSKTATMTTIGQDGILKTDIILPPIEKQKEFYDFVKQVDKSKF